MLQLVVFIFVTAFRDFRDSYQIEILGGLGLENENAIFTRTETIVTLCAMTALVVMKLLDSRKWGVIPNLLFMMLAFLTLGASTFLYDRGVVDGFTWIVLTGVGAYLAYVPCDTIFYERVISSTGWVGTAVFMACVMDAGGYTGSVALQIYKNLGSGDVSYLDFFRQLCYFSTFFGVGLIAIGLVYFPYKARQRRREDAAG